MKPILLVAFLCITNLACRKNDIKIYLDTNENSTIALEKEPIGYITFKELFESAWTADIPYFKVKELPNKFHLELIHIKIEGNSYEAYDFYHLHKFQEDNLAPYTITYILTKDKNIVNLDLESFPINDREFYLYENGEFIGDGNNKIKVKYQDETYALNYNYGFSNTGTTPQKCFAYFWVTTDISTGEIIDEKYIFTVCEPVYHIGTGDDNGGGGGAGGDEQVRTETEMVEWEVSRNTVPPQWSLISVEKITGLINPREPRGGHFKSIEHETHYLAIGHGKWTSIKYFTDGKIKSPHHASMRFKGHIFSRPYVNQHHPYDEVVDDIKSWRFEDVF
jgi:hypothetical protein